MQITKVLYIVLASKMLMLIACQNKVAAINISAKPKAQLVRHVMGNKRDRISEIKFLYTTWFRVSQPVLRQL